MTDRSPINRRSFLGRVVGGAVVVGGAGAFVTGTASAQVTDSDPTDGYGRGRGSITDSDPTDAGGRGRGTTDEESAGRGD